MRNKIVERLPIKDQRPKKMKSELEPPRIIDSDGDGTPDQYEVEDAVRTMQRAEMIKNDPKMMRHVDKHLQTHIKSLKSLKRLASRKALDEMDDSAE